MADIAILIGTHDRYRAAWPAICHGLSKYFPTKWPIYFATNHLDPPCGIGLKVGGDHIWGRNTRTALEKLNEMGVKVILWMLEDTWLIKSVDTIALKLYTRYVLMGEADHIRLLPSNATIRAGDFLPEPSLFVIDQNSPYRTSMCIGLWDVKTFLELIIDADTVWSFEKEGTMRSKGRRFLCAKVNPMPYVLPEEGNNYAWSPIKRGKWTTDAMRWAKAEGVEIDFSKYPKDY